MIPAATSSGTAQGFTRVAGPGGRAGARPACAKFLYGFQDAGRLARKSGDFRAAINRESSRAASGFDKGTLAMAHIGLTGAGEKPARSPTSVRAIAPCKIPPLRLCGSSPHPIMP